MRPFIDITSKSQAARWLDFYAGYIAAQEQILAEMLEVARKLPEETGGAIEETDIRSLRSVIEMCRRERDITRLILNLAAEKN
jgi:hypothetical protein